MGELGRSGVISLKNSIGFGFAAAMLAVAGTTFAGDGPSPLTELSPDGGDACFGRIYDARHMAAHPNQKVTRIFFFYGHDPVSRPNEEPVNGIADAGYNGFITTKVRGAGKPDWAGGWCAKDEESGNIHCGMECDRTMAVLKLDAKGGLVLNGINRDLYLDAGAEEELGPIEFERQALGTDDDGFALDRLPAEQCRKEFAGIDPIDPALGEPLRQRLKPGQPFCFGRDYSEAHLSSHPDQLTETIRLFRGPSEIASNTASRENWPSGAEIIVSVTTRSRSGKPVQNYSCDGEGDQWRCVATATEGAASCDLSEKEIYLRRGANGTMMLANPNSSMPIVDMCSTSDKTQSDDKVFRLDQMPLSACGL
jgi:hypothetical protein